MWRSSTGARRGPPSRPPGRGRGSPPRRGGRPPHEPQGAAAGRGRGRGARASSATRITSPSPTPSSPRSSPAPRGSSPRPPGGTPRAARPPTGGRTRRATPAAGRAGGGGRDPFFPSGPPFIWRAPFRARALFLRFAEYRLKTGLPVIALTPPACRGSLSPRPADRILQHLGWCAGRKIRAHGKRKESGENGFPDSRR